MSAPVQAGILTSLTTGYGGQFQGTRFYDGAYVDVNVDYAPDTQTYPSLTTGDDWRPA